MYLHKDACDGSSWWLLSKFNCLSISCARFFLFLMSMSPRFDRCGSFIFTIMQILPLNWYKNIIIIARVLARYVRTICFAVIFFRFSTQWCGLGKSGEQKCHDKIDYNRKSHWHAHIRKHRIIFGFFALNLSWRHQHNKSIDEVRHFLHISISP